MKRADYLAEVIRLYLLAPDTPQRARPRDWAIANALYQQRIPLETVAHAIRLAALRRHLRDSNLGPLEPIQSLAYFRTVIDRLDRNTLDPGYIEYVAFTYEKRLGGRKQIEAKARSDRQNTAVLNRR